MCRPVPGCNLEASFYPVVSKEVQEVQGSNEPEVHSFDIEVVKFRAALTDQAS
jgi:hypothetical protein